MKENTFRKQVSLLVFFLCLMIGGLAQAYNQTKTVNITTSGQTSTFSFTSVPTYSSATTKLVVSVFGDFDSTSEYASVYINNTFKGYVAKTADDAQCNTVANEGKNKVTFVLSTKELSSTMTIKVINSSGVNLLSSGTCSNPQKVVVSLRRDDLDANDTAPTVTDTTPYAGQYVYVTCSYDWDGNDTLPSLTAKVYLSDNSTISTSDTLLKTKTITNVTTGSHTVTITSVKIPIPTTSTNYIGCIFETGVSETSTLNNRSSGVSVGITYRDFQPVSITLNKAYGTSGNARNATIKFKFEGNVSIIGGVQIKVVLSTDTYLSASSDTVLATVNYTGNINAGGTFTTTAYFNMPSGKSTAKYKIGFILDTAYAYQEYNELDNNDSYTDFTYYNSIDFQPSTVTVTGGDIVKKSSTTTRTASVSLTYTGDIDLPPGASLQIKLYLSDNTYISGTDTFLKTITLTPKDGFKNGDTYTTSTYSVTINPTSVGTYYLGAVLDTLSEYTESSEANNNDGYYSQLTVYDSINFEPTSITSLDYAKKGSPTEVVGSFKYTGDVDIPAGNSVEVKFYISKDNKITTSDTLLHTMTTGNGFTRNQTYQVTASDIKTSAGTTSGTYYIGFILDTNDQYSESKEYDNDDRYKTIVIHGDMDIVPVSVTSDKNYVQTGVSTEYTFTFKYTGDISLPSVKINFYDSSDTTISVGDKYLGTTTFTNSGKGIVSGGVYTIKKSYALTATSGDNRYIGMYVDYGDSYPHETKDGRTNNTTYKKMAVYNSIDFTSNSIALKEKGTSTTLSPKQINAGGQVDVDYNITFTSDVTIPSTVKVRFYLATNSSLTSGLSILDTITIPTSGSLTHGLKLTGTRTVTIPTSATNRVYYIGYFVDYDGQYKEKNESDNKKSTTINVYKSVDFAATSISSTPRFVQKDDKQTITINITYNGGIALSDIDIAIFASVDSTVTKSDTLLYKEVKHFKANETYNPTLSITIPTSLKEGKYYIGVIVDYDSKIVETNESNNQKDNSAYVYYHDALDLSISSLILDKRMGRVTDTRKFTFSILNTGSKTAAIPFSEVDIQWSDTSTFTKTYSTNDFPKYSISTIPNGKKSFSINQGLSAVAVKEGNIYWRVRADHFPHVKETDENNNDSVIIPFTIYDRVDFVPKSLSSTKVLAKEGETVTLTCQFTTEQAKTGMKFYDVSVRFYHTSSATDNSGSLLVHKEGITATAGQTTTVSASVTIPSNGAGDYHFGCLVDRADDYVETTESNNYKTIPFTIYKNINIAPAGFAVSKKQTTISSSVTFSGSVKYSGDNATLSSVRYAIFEGTKAGELKTLIKDGTLSKMTKGQATSIPSFTYTTPSTEGNYHYTLVVDYGNGFVETNEADNTSGVTLAVYKAVDLAVTSVSFSGSAKNRKIGTSQTINLTYSYAGKVTLPEVKVTFRLSYLNSTITTSDKLLLTKTLTNVAPTSGKSITISATIPSSATQGNNYLGATINEAKEIIESDTSNNTKASPSYYFIYSDFDLVANKPTTAVSKTYAESGTTGLKVYYSVTHAIGTLKAQGVNVRFYISKDTILTTADTLLGSTNLTMTPSSTPRTGSNTFTVPSLPSGRYYIGFVVDILNSFPETNEKNNTQYVPFYITEDKDKDGYETIAGTCTSAGFTLPSCDCNDKNKSINPKGTEICNGEDDDCDGKVDENSSGGVLTQSCYSGSSATKGVGPCKAGTQTCSSGNWGSCSGEVTPKTDICDGIDNDCDGETDEDFTNKGKDCTAGLGVCANRGKFVCTSDGSGTECSVKPLENSTTETCNNKDDDCDGKVDENSSGGPLTQSCYSKDPSTKGVGECKSGTQTCSAGDWSTCTGEVTPIKENCDGKDNDCDGFIDEDFDMDGDKFFTKSKAGGNGKTCADYTPYANANKFDCNDTNNQIYPGRKEDCNGKDDDCDGKIDEDFDKDGDKFPGSAYKTECGSTYANFDCNDNDSKIYPGAKEICDGSIDHNCDGVKDDGCDCANGTSQTCGINKGECAKQLGTQKCENGQWKDCVGDRRPVDETCNGKDDNCNGAIDEDFDKDGDGFFTSAVADCINIAKYPPSKLDCNDDPKQDVNAHKINPGSAEICNKKDDDCDGKIDEDFDKDGDNHFNSKDTNCQTNYPSKLDCNDNDAQVNHGLKEVCDSKDNDCDGKVDEDFDKDGDGFTTCGSTDGKDVVSPAADKFKDCNDDPSKDKSASSIFPGASELCDGIDNDCDGKVDESWPTKGDSCELGTGACKASGKLVCNTAKTGTVCDAKPTDPKEEVCNGLDDDCDGQTDENKEGNTLQESCYTGPTDTVDKGTCKSGTRTCKSGAWDTCEYQVTPSTEVCDGKDNDCDGQTDEDFDKDGDKYTTCGSMNGTTVVSIDPKYKDCSDDPTKDPNAAKRNPGAKEECDGVDNNCDGSIDEGFDKDGDKYTTCGSMDGTKVVTPDPKYKDCSDDPVQNKNAANIYPGAKLVCDNNYSKTGDNNCNGKEDGQELSCQCTNGQKQDCGTDVGLCTKGEQSCIEGSWGECSGQKAVTEICDGKDNDCDGQTDEDFDKDGDKYTTCGSYNGSAFTEPNKSFEDCDDSTSTGSQSYPGKSEVCDGFDNNCDGYIDNQSGKSSKLTKSCTTNDCQGTSTCKQLSSGGYGYGTCVPDNATTEVCDGKDNDCDGSIDEGFDKDGDKYTTCGSMDGTKMITPNDKYKDCSDDPTQNKDAAKLHPGAQELCDQVDNDCDGQTDEDFTNLGNSCSAGVGECKVTGSYQCSSDGSSTVCSAKAGESKSEECNGKDDDCDGQIDENDSGSALTRSCYTGDSGTRGVSPCQDGTQTCKLLSTGVYGYGSCEGEITPTKDNVCDGIDNDCDGQTDEDVPNLGEQCTVGIGACKNSGTTVCKQNSSGSYEVRCSAAEKPSSKESCNGIDDDCDGSIDEDFPETHIQTSTGKSTPCSLGDGICKADGFYVCDKSSGLMVCDAKVGTPSTPSCNGKDNDCNGTPDVEELSSCKCTDGAKQPCGNEKNLSKPCKAGEQVCTGGSWGTCQGEVQPTKEVCNGVDDDCDGSIDEDDQGKSLTEPCYSGPSGTDGKGVCTSGVKTCSSGTYGTCNGEVTPTTEVCDGKDNNCDGQIDEGIDANGDKKITQNETFDKDHDGFSICGFVVDTSTKVVTKKEVDCNDNDSAIYPGAKETCNGKDDDCDGKVDEDVDGDKDGYSTCGTIYDATSGKTVTKAKDCDDTNAAIKPGATEVCNGQDDDCDGQVDNQAGKATSLEKSCSINGCQGLQACQKLSSGGYGFGSCVATNASTEVCDGKDNDCDGQIDEGHDQNGDGKITQSETFDKDGDGHKTCGTTPDCDDSDKENYPGNKEVCDSKDNNCDGKTDEGFNVGSNCSVGVGECLNDKAIIICDGEGKAKCEGKPKDASTEVCDGKDNDCDGQTDEDFSLGTQCSIGVGECADKNGKFVCDTTTLKAKCGGKPSPPTDELCDGKDNDCDGNIDNGFALDQPCSVGKGACKNTGKNICSQDGKSVVCDAKPGTPTSKEACDGSDSDCDGDPLNGCACKDGESKDCGSKEGECGKQPQGKQVCTNGTWGSCTNAPKTTAEVCDGKDNDCDGSVDEDFPEVANSVTTACTVGKGNCKKTGVFQCKSDSTGVECSVKPGRATSENCDGEDNDCDGQIDNGYDVGINCSVGVGACKTNGTKVCNNDLSGTVCKPSSTVPKASKELCDGIDNDCDGQTDEDFKLGQKCFVGQGQCKRESIWLCQNDKAVCNTTAGTPGNEVCDGLDNDCDGSVDENETDPTKTLQRECYSGKSGTAGIGVCKKGKQICEKGVWQACTGEVVPERAISSKQPEKCDTVDNNCNGQVDEGCQCVEGKTKSCGKTQGDCSKQTGQSTCESTGTWGECKNEIKAQKEICDGRDNDCDGQTDEDFSKLNTPCSAGVGECKKTGTFICNNTKDGTTCDAKAGKVNEEVCDGKDNDCNGLIDDQVSRTCYTGTKGTDGVGICQSGIQNCANGTWEKCLGEVTPEAEVSASQPEKCDGKDNNCNGQVDEKCTCKDGITQPCGKTLGECRQGKQTCASGSWGSCVGEVKPSTEVCDGKDNNCDGKVDEGFNNLNRSCEIGIGECLSLGVFVCTKDGSGTVCNAKEQKPSTEVCDGKDNDCDGEIDETFAKLNEYCSAGQGSCKVQGIYVCKKDGSDLECNANSISGAKEVCDGKDNDCDGHIDEDETDSSKSMSKPCYNGPKDTKDVGACKGGKVTCSNGIWGACKGDVRPTPEICDQVDNDCNGKVDDAKKCQKEEPVEETIKETASQEEPVAEDAGSEEIPETTPETTSCYVKGCKKGQICKQGTCIDDPCEHAACGDNEFCRDGKCIEACGCKTCPTGDKCVDGMCLKDKCNNAECKQGEVCNPNTGTCQKETCSNVTCQRGQVCKLGSCVDAPCAHIQCPKTMACSDGQCIGKTCGKENVEEVQETIEEQKESTNDASETVAKEETTKDDSRNDDVPVETTPTKETTQENIIKKETTSSPKDNSIAKPEDGCGCSSNSPPPLFTLFLFFLLFPLFQRKKPGKK